MAEEVEVLEGWRRVRLGDVLIENKKSPFKVEDADNEGTYPFFTSGDNILNHSIYLVDGENLFLSTGGTAHINYYEGKASYSADTYSIKSKINTKYLYYFALRKIGYITFRFFIGSGLEHLQKDDLKNSFKVVYPQSIEEQRKIAEIFETVDNAIERTDTIIEKYKRIKQGLMQDLLTRGVVENDELGVMSYELRDEKKHRFKDSPLGRIPEEWVVVELGEVGKIISGSTPDTSNKEFWDGDIVWITPDDLSKSKKYIDNSSRKITLKGLRSCSAKLIKEDSIIISSRAPIGYLEINKVQIATNQGCKSIELNNNIFVEFFYYNLHRYIQKMINLGSGTTFTEISKSQLKKMMISLPKSIEEQHIIASILSQMDQTIEKEQKYKQKLESIKQGLMEDLLTGKVRVNHLIKQGEKNVQPA